MKILEIIDPVIQNKQYKGTFKRKSKFFSDRKDNEDKEKDLGHGYYASVKHDPTDPHMAVKTSILDKGSFASDAKNDPYWLYINDIIKNKLYENPYFPRVYVLKNFTDKKGEKIKRIKMEKLFELCDLSLDELNFLVAKTFGKENVKHIENYIYGGIRDCGDFAMLIKENIMEIAYKFEKNAIDPLFLQFSKYINNFRNQHENIHLDLHAKNMMIRKSPYGPQLVITDPFATYDV